MYTAKGKQHVEDSRRLFAVFINNIDKISLKSGIQISSIT